VIVTLERFKKIAADSIFKEAIYGVVSGGFDPLHIGHVRYIKEASKLCEFLIVIVNGDSFLHRKKGFVFMQSKERAEIIDSIKGVTITIIFDSESDTVDDILREIKPSKFFKGGDRLDRDSIPEWNTCDELGIEVVTNVGGGKIQSSSDLTR